ncbi:MAG: hypothetical protein ACAI35_21540 [Candidatus Methylacidiphilales bacterium]
MANLLQSEENYRTGLWEALERTAKRSKAGEFNPTPADWELINKCICRPVARKFGPRSEELDLTNEIISGNPCTDYEGDFRFSGGLAHSFGKALECSSIRTQDGWSRDKAVASYCRRICENVLRNVHCRSFRRLLRDRLFRAIRDSRLIMEADEIIELRDLPRLPLFPAEEITMLAKALGHRVPEGTTQEYPYPLPTTGQIGKLTEQVLRESAKSFLVDDLIELAREVFDVRADSEPKSLDEPMGEEGITLHETLMSRDIEPPFGYLDDIDQIAGRVIQMLRDLDRGEERSLTQGSYYRTFFEFWAWRDEKLGDVADSPRVTATAYSLKTKIPDSTLASRSEKIFSNIRGLASEFDRTAIGTALGRLKADNMELFRKCWDLLP